MKVTIEIDNPKGGRDEHAHFLIDEALDVLYEIGKEEVITSDMISSVINMLEERE